MGRTASQNMQLKIAAKPLLLCCHLANTNEELGGFVTAILPFDKLLWSLFICSTDKMLSECHGQLSAEGFYLHEGGLYCTDHYQSLFGIKCSYCNQFISGEVASVLQYTYHDVCFCCTVCRPVIKHFLLHLAKCTLNMMNLFMILTSLI